MTERVNIESLMQESGVAFGTSGARGLVSAMTDRVCSAYLLAFLGTQAESGALRPGDRVAIAGDRRPSTPRILRALASAIRSAGYVVDDQGLIPSPALALHGMRDGIPTAMVTGSHIPADRNGMKFTTRAGEITKADEERIRRSTVELRDSFDAAGMLVAPEARGVVGTAALTAYERRYFDAFPKGCLSGLRIGVYGHSAVGRDVLTNLYRAFGAEIVPLGFSEEFVPVDTEAIRDEDVLLARAWAEEYRLDSIVSTDGDSDRPLLADERGEWLRGDVLGIHTARYFGADAVATPVSCNGALEICGEFPRIERTRIGSPFVIAGMQHLVAQGGGAVVGYEANGGFLHATPLAVPGGGVLPPLPTRDPVIVQLATLLAARERGVPLSALAETLPPRFTASGRDPAFRTESSLALLATLRALSPEEKAAWFGLGALVSESELDGLRMTFAPGDVVHLRPSGNAPELRVYGEAATEARARELVELGLCVARERVTANAARS